MKWTYFATGIMAGIIAVLLTVVIMQNREPQAWAAPPVPQGTDNNGAGLMLATGGAQTQTQDILWVVYRREGGRTGGKDGLGKNERLVLTCYQVANGARTIKLVAVRDISFDVDVVEYGNDKPHVKDIIDELKKTLPKDPPK